MVTGEPVNVSGRLYVAGELDLVPGERLPRDHMGRIPLRTLTLRNDFMLLNILPGCDEFITVSQVLIPNNRT